MRVKKYLALTLAALFAATMLTGCPWDIEDDAASDSSSAPSSSSRPSHDGSDDSGSTSSSPSTPDDEESENPGDEESEKPTPTEIIKKYSNISDDGTTLTITDTRDLEDNDTFRNALNKASDITTISFDTGVTSIPDGAFKDCTNLTNVELGGVTEIGSNAFRGCSSLTSIDLGSVTSIGGLVFYECTSLTSVDLGKVTHITVETFSGCTKLTSIDLSNVETIDANVFSGCTNLAHIRLGAGIQATYVTTNAFDGIAKTVHVYYGDTKEKAQEKWTSLNVTPSGTTFEYHPASEWENRENNDNATEALPDAMKDLLALTERLG